MPEGPGTFSMGQIALSALIGAVLSFVVVWFYGRWSKEATLTPPKRRTSIVWLGRAPPVRGPAKEREQAHGHHNRQ